MKKNIYLILADEDIFHPRFVRDIIKHLDKNEYAIVGITITKDRHRKGLLYFLRQQYELWGFTGFLFLIFATILSKTLSYIFLTKQLSLRAIARVNNLPLIYTYNVNDASHLDYLKNLRIDIIISSNGHIFKNELLRIPKIACINRHTALLPKYGGVLPVFWAMLHNETVFGVSVHFMTEKIDAGDIIYQKQIPIKKNVSLFKNYISGFEKSSNVTLKALENLKQNKISKKFNKHEATYYSFPELSQMRSFRRKSKSFFLSDIKVITSYYLSN